MPTPLPEPPEEETSPGAQFNKEKRRSQLWQLEWKLLGFKYCGIYAISQMNSGWPIKIGISAKVATRLCDLQVAQWNQLDVFHYWVCENSISARKVEHAVHAILRKDDKQMSGEWFDIREDEVPAIVEFIADREGIELVKELPKMLKFAEVHARLEQINTRYEGQFERDQMKNRKDAKDIDWAYNYRWPCT